MAENNRILNYQYAPGIATYGIDGPQGAKGEPGTSFFFTSFDLTNTNGTETDEFLQKVSNNRQLTSYWDAPSEREYVSGDLVLDVAATLYRIYNVAGQWKTERVARLKHLLLNDYFGHDGNNRIFLVPETGSDTSTNVKGLDIIVSDNPDAAEGYRDADDMTLLRVISEKKDSAGNYNLMSLMTKTSSDTKKYLNIKYNENDDAFTLDSNSDVIIDCKSLSVDYNQTGSAKKGSDKYRITPYNDNIGLIHYVFSQAVLTASPENDKDIYIYVPNNKSKDLTNLTHIYPDFIRIEGTGTGGTRVQKMVMTNTSNITKDSNVADPSEEIEWRRITYTLNSEDRTGILERDMSKYRVYLVKGVEVMLNYANSLS